MSARLRQLIDAIAAADDAAFARLLDAEPGLATATLEVGASREAARANFIARLGAYAYAGDTALHFAAAAWRSDLIARLIAAGADPGARNRLGGEPLHYAAAGDPRSPRWNPQAQAAAIAALVGAGADPNARDRNGASPLHRAVRTRCAGAVAALLAAGADPRLATKAGSSPARLAEVNSGRGGSGAAAAKAQQAEIQRLLAAFGD